MQNPPKHSVTGTQAREKVFGIQVDKSRYSVPPMKGMHWGGRSSRGRRSWLASRDAAPGPPISGRGGYVNSFPKYSVTGAKARETEIGIQVEIQGGAPPIKGMPLGARSL